MHRIGYILPEGFQIIGLGTQAVFELANAVAREPFYAVESYALDGAVRASAGLTVQARPLTARSQADTWLVAGVLSPLSRRVSPELPRLLEKLAPRSRRVAGLCTGAFLLAEAGLLDERRATTHWYWADALQQRHPRAQVEADRIYIADGAVWTSAGMTAEMDLALALVEKDLGAELARAVAHRLVMHQRRSGGQSQHSEMLRLAPKSDRIQQALEHARRNLARPLSVEDLAQAASLSPRQFSRVFTAETGQSPAKAIEGLRLEAARLMIESSRHPLEVVARETGFRDRRHLREAFLRGFGMPPQAVRRDARTSPPGP
ncbi:MULTISPECIES: GlxA family transcriptional regulator [Achromobacter]|uniref:GlxA family transcriptional regulator n=1 Tax=Alcaligenes xylosoxydans xylosoxydans TaxID=85698 RepID=A0A424WH03_ALCXX|nr:MULTISPECIES: GlxA family transcriptional regulator [Achromobacter]MBC9904909.1 GlxA family transcriptional regulator [Achromobacter xylosoxidans]MBD0867539.1 GlxA family transcriptional regulator [Achromobacter xylosoxidans]MDH1303031.1 GlxA family transcriptional regulator [Achromobacter sp. GD03932]QNP88550.1 GlxA family transcriptional regulator [Achromobacter xylosoxidans]RPJ92439.1 GlxA family transcriptional regulator [Achromobacter xylosoxidans]